MAYVYRHIRQDKDEPFYIGIAKKDTPNYERAYNKSPQHRNRHWINIYNKTPIEVEILFSNVTYDFAKDKEIEFIALYKRRSDGGTLVNLTKGGDGVLGVKNPKLSERNKAGIWIGRKHSEETKARMSIRHMGRKVSDEHRKRISESKIGVYAGDKNPNYKGKIYAYDLKFRLIGIANSVADASKMLGLKSNSLISRSLAGNPNRIGVIFSRLNIYCPMFFQKAKNIILSGDSRIYKKAISPEEIDKRARAKQVEKRRGKKRGAYMRKSLPLVRAKRPQMSGANSPLSNGAILCYNKQLELINEFPSSLEAKEFFNDGHTNKITRAIARGGNHKGFVLKYKNP